MTKLNEYKDALQQTEQQINQLSIQRERLVGAISVLQVQEQAEEEPSEGAAIVSTEPDED